MPSGVYERNESHKEISRIGGINSPSKFKKGHTVSLETRVKISNSKKKQKYSSPSYSRIIARKIVGANGYDENVHHKDGNPLNNDPNNLVILKRSEHTKLHWQLNKHGNK